MTKKSAPAFEHACAILDAHYNQSLKILTVRQLKSACGGSGSLSTYSEYRDRWRQDRILQSGIFSTLLVFESQIEGFAKGATHTLNTLRSQMQTVPLFMPDDEALPEADPTKPAEDASLEGEKEGTIRTTEAVPNESVESENEGVKRLAEIAAAKSEPRFLDGSSRQGDAGDKDAVHPERAMPRERFEKEAPEKEKAPLSRADMGGQQSTLPLGANQSRGDERGTMHDGGAS